VANLKTYSQNSQQKGERINGALQSVALFRVELVSEFVSYPLLSIMTLLIMIIYVKVHNSYALVIVRGGKYEVWEMLQKFRFQSEVSILDQIYSIHFRSNAQHIFKHNLELSTVANNFESYTDSVSCPPCPLLVILGNKY
jgi:hypothetical protein